MPDNDITATTRVAATKPAGIAAIIFAVLLGLASAYFAAAGWVIANLDSEIYKKGPQQTDKTGQGVVYDGIPFLNIYQARQAVEKDKLTSWFTWTYSVPSSLPLLITAFSFGILGGLTSVIFKAVCSEVQTNRRVVLKPLLGGLIGIMVLGITYVLPAALMVNENKVSPVSLAFLCMYAGAFSNHVYIWLEEKIKTVFAIEKSK